MGDMHRPVENGARMTLEEWAALPEDVPGELVDGRLVEEEMPSAIHEAIVAWLILVLSRWVLPKGGGVLASGAKFAVSRERGRKPDLTVYLPDRDLPPGRASLLVGPPSVAIEVVSPRPRDVRRDRVEKLDEYAAFGVPWYWIVDPELRTVEIFELQPDSRYAHALGASAGSIDEVPGCPGLALDLDELWAYVSRFEDTEGSDTPGG